MAAVHCQNKDGFAGKEGTALHRFIYGEFFNMQKRFLGYLKEHEK